MIDGIGTALAWTAAVAFCVLVWRWGVVTWGAKFAAAWIGILLASGVLMLITAEPIDEGDRTDRWQ